MNNDNESAQTEINKDLNKTKSNYIQKLIDVFIDISMFFVVVTICGLLIFQFNYSEFCNHSKIIECVLDKKNIILTNNFLWLRTIGYILCAMTSILPAVNTISEKVKVLILVIASISLCSSYIELVYSSHHVLKHMQYYSEAFLFILPIYWSFKAIFIETEKQKLNLAYMLMSCMIFDMYRLLATKSYF